MVQAARRAQVTWEGNLVQGQGTIVSSSSGALQNMPVTWASRTERPDGKTSPEELIAAAHAECFAMVITNNLTNNGTPATSLTVDAVCTFVVDNQGPRITTMDLSVSGSVPGMDAATFDKFVQDSEQGCPVSNALRNNVAITVHTQLNNS
jgi:osmotically inducible protein OsmC